MDAKLIITHHDLRDLPLKWYGQYGEQKKIEQALKKAVGSMYDNARLMLSVNGYLFSFDIYRESCAEGSIAHKTYKSHPDFKFYGEPVWGKSRLTNVFTWHMWNVRGSTAIGSGVIVQDPEQPLEEKVCREIIDLADNYTKGKVHCSDCGKVMNRDDIAGRYFAGVYCDDCWNGKWKAIEAAENYN